jgi:putative salt-induced outer membrane protein YdiY
MDQGEQDVQIVDGVVAAVAAALVAVPAHAQWKTKGELGASIARGNSESESVNGAIEVTYTRDKWEHVAGSPATMAMTEPTRRLSVGKSGASRTIPSTRRPLVRRGALRGRPLQLVRLPGFALTGLGYKFNDTERTKFWVQGGPGYRYANVRETGETTRG